MSFISLKLLNNDQMVPSSIILNNSPHLEKQPLRATIPSHIFSHFWINDHFSSHGHSQVDELVRNYCLLQQLLPYSGPLFLFRRVVIVL